jgi:hypothetical protein
MKGNKDYFISFFGKKFKLVLFFGKISCTGIKLSSKGHCKEDSEL